MGMSIEESIAELEVLKENTFSYMLAHQAFVTAINTMHKYRKIEKIINAPIGGTSAKYNAIVKLIKYSEVLENGNDD